MNQKSNSQALSPGALTARRFFRNRLAVAGLVILGFFFLFSFVGGALMPYSQDQVFYRQQLQSQEFAGASENTQFRFLTPPDQTFGPVLQAQFLLYQDSFSLGERQFTVLREGEDLYSIWENDTLLCVAHKDILTPAQPFALTFAALKAHAQHQSQFDGYSLQGGILYHQGQELGRISRLSVQPKVGDALPAGFSQAAEQAISQKDPEFTFSGAVYTLYYDAASQVWSIRQQVSTRVYDAYAAPSREHLLGTDKNGMDMLTRLMYGGRVSLLIGFLVVLIAGLLGVILGGIAGYFGGWADELLMRVVDIFYCIPSTPVLIILGAAMDGMRLDPRIRMLYLMLLLGFLGWPSIARLVRGQILSLREQEFMTAAEAAGLSARRRIFHHLIPNVVPQLMVTCTMSLGSTILTEATLSFLGLGVKFPFASWGNIMNDVANAHVLTSYWFVWIPAGACLMLTVLGFNFVGDGLRDAFDPKMKR